MAGYSDTRQLIIDTLMGRPAGTEIQPEDHQAFALQITDYVRAVELVAGNATPIGFAEATTVPVQPDNGQAVYLSQVNRGTTVTFANFIDQNGNAISVTSDSSSVTFVTLLWNGQYWSSQTTVVSASVLTAETFRVTFTQSGDTITASDSSSAIKNAYDEGKLCYAITEDNHIAILTQVESSSSVYFQSIYSQTKCYYKLVDTSVTKTAYDDLFESGSGENSILQRNLYNTADGDASASFGSACGADGYCSHAEGQATIASGSSSHTEGIGTRTNNNAEHAEGAWNVSHSSDDKSKATRHSIGIGSSDSDRKNADEIMRNGDHYVLGLGGYDGTNAGGTNVKPLKQVVDEKASEEELTYLALKVDEIKGYEYTPSESDKETVFDLNGTWKKNNANYNGIFRYIKGVEKIKIIANDTRTSLYSLVKSKDATQGETISYATGCSRQSLAAGASITLSVPDDAMYLWICYNEGADIIDAPTKIIVSGEIDSIQENLEEEIDELEKIVKKNVDVVLSPAYENGYMRYAEHYISVSSTARTYVFPVENILLVKTTISAFTDSVPSIISFFSGTIDSGSSASSKWIGGVQSVVNQTEYIAEVPEGAKVCAISTKSTEVLPTVSCYSAKSLTILEPRVSANESNIEVVSNELSSKIFPFNEQPCFYHWNPDGFITGIPSQSVEDNFMAKRLGFKFVEANVQETATTGKYIITHGSGGKFGSEFSDDYKDTLISSMSYDDILANVKYNSENTCYNHAVSTPEVFFKSCAQLGLGINLRNAALLPIARKYLNDDMIVLPATSEVRNNYNFKGILSAYIDSSVPSSSITADYLMSYADANGGTPMDICLLGSHVDYLISQGNLDTIVGELRNKNIYIGTCYASSKTIERLIAVGGCGIASGIAQCNPSIESVYDMWTCLDSDMSQWIVQTGLVVDGGVISNPTDSELTLATPRMTALPLAKGYVEARAKGDVKFIIGELSDMVYEDCDETSPICLCCAGINKDMYLRIKIGANSSIEYLRYTVCKC